MQAARAAHAHHFTANLKEPFASLAPALDICTIQAPNIYNQNADAACSVAILLSTFSTAPRTQRYRHYGRRDRNSVYRLVGPTTSKVRIQVLRNWIHAAVPGLRFYCIQSSKVRLPGRSRILIRSLNFTETT